MSRLCPRPCCQLLIAAFLIAIGVVQAIAGTVLLKSSYITLLSVPDYWTSVANTVVGFLLGITASVWKKPRYRRSFKCEKHRARDRLVTALLFSSLLLNATTLLILILGKARSVLLIDLKDIPIVNPSILGKKVVSYAFAVSVVCPVLAMVLILFKLAGKCFPKSESNDDEATSKGKRALRRSHSQPFDWVFVADDEKTPSRPVQRLSSSSGSECDISLINKTSLVFSSPQLSTSQIPTKSDIERPLYVMELNKKSIANPSGGACAPDSPIAGDVVAIRIPRQFPSNQCVVAVHSSADGLKDGIRSPVSTRTTKSSNIDVGRDKTSFSSFKVSLNEKLKEQFIKNCPEVELERNPRKSDGMESIREVSSQEREASSPTMTSGYNSNLETTINASIKDASPEPKNCTSKEMTPKMESPDRRTGAIAKVNLFHQELSRSTETML